MFDLSSIIPDLIYTPLDISTNIPYKKPLLIEWLDNNYKSLFYYKSKLSTAEEVLKDDYLWDLIPVNWNIFDDGPGWLNDFDKDFYDLKNFICDEFKLFEKDLGAVVFLKMRPTYSGWGFWHIDADPFGLRIMLDVDVSNEKLYVKKFKKNMKKDLN
jgi:hypothetical protein